MDVYICVCYIYIYICTYTCVYIFVCTCVNLDIFMKILLTCTTEVPFYDHLGNIYIPSDSVSMGSVWGPIFRNFYMSDLENEICNCIKKNLNNIHIILRQSWMCQGVKNMIAGRTSVNRNQRCTGVDWSRRLTAGNGSPVCKT